MFGVAIMMTLVTTIIAPIALVPLFRGRPGKRGEEAEPVVEAPITIEMPQTISEHFLQLLLAVFQERGFGVDYRDIEAGIYQLQRGDLVASVNETDGRVVVQVPATSQEIVDDIVHEAETRLVEAVRQFNEIPPPGTGLPSAPANST
jgi:hypothetical protein